MTQPLDRSSAALAAPLLPPHAEGLEIAAEDDIRFTRGPRSYRVRGLARNLSAESLKVTLRLSAGEHLHLDTLDLYQAWPEQVAGPPIWHCLRTSSGMRTSTRFAATPSNSALGAVDAFRRRSRH